jgi:hypothetical protein
MEKPERPLPSECCESGCSICIFDLYADRLKAYKIWFKEQAIVLDKKAD